MPNHQIVIISGKTCSGKTGLANLLKERYGFKILSTRAVLSDQIESSAETNDRAKLTELASQLDKETNYHWVVKATQDMTQHLADGDRVVVDHVYSPEQVEEFRKEFGPDLVHVHLYATDQTLCRRYKKSPEGQKPDAPEYTQVNHPTDKQTIERLRNDADVRIFTDRTDDSDTLVRVAAHLHLFTPPEVRCVDVLVGGQYGSEGKGNIVAYLAREYDVLVRVGGPNAGHTVANSSGTLTHHLLPSGTTFSKAKVLLGPGITINVENLLREIDKSDLTPERLFIDPQATIIEEEDIEQEMNGVVGAISSTGSGSGSAKARRILYRGSTDKKVLLAKDIQELKQYIGSTAEHLEQAYRAGHSILLEGTQGSGLSLYHGHYPYVTSRDTNVAGCLAEAGISPSRVRKILMVVRTTPIRVADPNNEDGSTSGKLKHETEFSVVADKAGLDPSELASSELTSTTRRPRRVGWFEWDQFRKACDLNAPTDIVLTFADYLDANNRNARRFEQLTPNTIKFIEELERVAQAPVSLISTRFPKENVDFRDLRSIIDRRNWTARSTNR